MAHTFLPKGERTGQEVQLDDFSNGKCRGIFDTLADAQREIARLGITDFEIVDLEGNVVDCTQALTTGAAAVAVASLLFAICGVWAATIAAAAMVGPIQ